MLRSMGVPENWREQALWKVGARAGPAADGTTPR